MSRVVFDGNYHVYWLDTPPAAPAAPTTAEITAGTDITAWIPKDGFNPNVSNNRVTGGDLSSQFIDESMGTYSSQLSITTYLDDETGANLGFDTLGVAGATGALVVCPFGPAAAAAPAYVWPDVEIGHPNLMQTGENTRQKFTADLAVRKEPNFHAAVAA